MKGNFNEIINGKLPVLVDFYAEWCGPCKVLAPILKDVSKEMKGKVRIIKIDIDKNQKLSTQYRVRGVPTLLLFKNGKVVWTESGVKTKVKLLSVLEQNL